MFPQETLDNLRKAMANTHIMCATMLDTKVRNSSCQHRRQATGPAHAAIYALAAWLPRDSGQPSSF